ncbi:MAG: GNAT family N-acetyltransferase [Candidatus Aquilonibacter sp.]
MELLRTNRLLFRTHEARDEGPFVAMHTDDEVRRFVGGRGWPDEKARERFRTQYLGKPTQTYGLWATVLFDEDKYIGTCGIASAAGRAHLAYYIARPFWGQGFATEAAAAFIAFAKERLALEALYADVETGHAASERVLCKFGFARTGHTFIAASGRDISHYRLAPL